nr:hypothetical protein [Tanacetum cinerariifolium]
MTNIGSILNFWRETKRTGGTVIAIPRWHRGGGSEEVTRVGRCRWQWRDDDDGDDVAVDVVEWMMMVDLWREIETTVVARYG